MTTISKQTVLRTTVLFTEGDRPEYHASTRTTLVVTRAVLEDIVGGSETLTVYGYRKERPPTYAGWEYAGGEPKQASYHAPYPAAIAPIVELMRRP